MKILVAYGSERGGTAGIAEHVASALRARGADVDLAPANRVRDVRPYDAVVVGGALYGLHWHERAFRFVVRHAEALRARDGIFFSSGPLDDSASRTEIPPVRQVRELMAHVGARGHATFGGRLAPDAAGFPAAAMAKTSAGDWRDFARVEAWAGDVLATLASPRPARAAPVPLPSRTVPLVLAAAASIASIVMMVELARGGAAIAAVAVALLVALPMLGATWLHAVREEYGSFASIAGGGALAITAIVVLATGGTPIAIAAVALAVALASIADGLARARATTAEWKEAAEQAPHAPA